MLFQKHQLQEKGGKPGKAALIITGPTGTLMPNCSGDNDDLPSSIKFLLDTEDILKQTQLLIKEGIRKYCWRLIRKADKINMAATIRIKDKSESSFVDRNLLF